MTSDTRTREQLLAEIEALKCDLEAAKNALRAEKAKDADRMGGEAVYRAIGESIDYGVWVCAPDGRNLYASDSFLDLVGITQEQCSNFGWGNVLHPDDAAKTVEAWKECTRTGGKWDIEHRYLGADGEYHDILARGVPVKDDNGEIICWAGINLDISGFKRFQKEMLQSNERLGLISRAARRLLESESPQTVVDSLCHDIMALLDCDTFFNYLLDEYGERLHLNACAGISAETRAGMERLDYGVAVCGCVARDAHRIIVDHVQETDEARTELIRSLGITAYACFPLVVHGEVLGTLSFGTRKRTHFSDDDVALIQAVADQVAIAMERKRSRVEIERLATFPQLNPNPVIEVDMSGRITFCNRAARVVAESIGAGDVHVFVPSDLAEILPSISRGEGQQWLRELEIGHRSYQLALYYSEQFRTIRLYVNDISALKMNQERLRRVNEELERRVASRTADLNQIIERIQRESSERLKIETELLKSNERYILAVQGANDGIWDWDFETGTAFVSSRWKNMLGYDDDEFRDVVGEWKRLIHPDDYNRALVLLEDYLNGRVSDYQMEYRLRHKDGSYRWILTRGACFRNSGGKPYRMAGSHTDITERKLDEERLNRLNRLYVVLSETGLAILRATNQQAIFQDICRIVVERGRFMLAWIGLADAESGQVAVAASYGDVGYLEAFRISARNGEADCGPAATAIREGMSYISNDYQNDPRTIPWHEGAIAHGINSTASTPLWRGGAVIGALTLCAAERDFFDIEMIGLLEQMAGNISFALDSLEIAACRLEAEAALRNETIERLKAVEDLSAHERIMMQQGRHAAMGEMIGNIAHQWRQPLNTLGLIIQQIKFFYEIGEFSGEFLNSSTIKAMDVIRNMSNTIDDFRDFFRSDKEKGLFSINQAIQQAIALIEANFNYHSIGLDVALADNGSINGYANEFSQAVLNIMVNARDVLVEREVAGGQVRVRSQNNDGTLAIIISDNGGGIREEIMEKIFDPYFTTKGPVKGTGIGLYMAKTIIEQNMGGRLTASNGESGAVFRIEVKNDGC